MTTVRTDYLQGFLDATAAAFRAGAKNSGVQACTERVFDRLARAVPHSGIAGREVPTVALLNGALAQPLAVGGAVASLTERLADLAPHLCWRLRGETPENAHLAGIANAMIVGPGGLEDRQDVWVGLSLMPPGMTYPEHNHPPEEIYLFLSPGQFRHGDSGWFAPGIGGTLYNEPGIRHAMEADTEAPLLALWCLYDHRHF